MTNTRIFSSFSRVLTSTRLLVVALVAAFAGAAAQPAAAQSADTWKSVAIIGGTTAAGAYLGHKIGGNTGAILGASMGAAGGYAIDKKRRDNEYNNEYGYYGNRNGYYGQYPDSGYYGNGNGGYYGSGNGGYYGNDGYYGDRSGGYYGQNGGYAGARNGNCDRASNRRNHDRDDYYQGSDGMYHRR